MQYLAAKSLEPLTGETLDTTAGKSVVGVSGFLIGGFASGGPIGALAGAGVGWILGDKTQEALGVGGKAYRVTTESGEEIVVRSPNKHWENGDQVRIVGNRLVAESSVLEVSSR